MDAPWARQVLPGNPGLDSMDDEKQGLAMYSSSYCSSPSICPLEEADRLLSTSPCQLLTDPPGGCG